MSRLAKSVYVVQGSAGEYEDSEWWIVAVFTNQSRAEKFCLICNQKAKKSYEEVEERKRLWREKFYGEGSRQDDGDEADEVESYPEPEKFPEDPDAVIEHNTHYYVSEIRLNPVPK